MRAFYEWALGSELKKKSSGTALLNMKWWLEPTFCVE